MNTAFILAIIVLGALSAALGAMLAAARGELADIPVSYTHLTLPTNSRV